MNEEAKVFDELSSISKKGKHGLGQPTSGAILERAGEGPVYSMFVRPGVRDKRVTRFGEEEEEEGEGGKEKKKEKGKKEKKDKKKDKKKKKKKGSSSSSSSSTSSSSSSSSSASSKPAAKKAKVDTTPRVISGPVGTVFAVRLLPGSDVKASLEAIVAQHNIVSGFISSAAGSLTKATLRLAEEEVRCSEAKFEVLSLGGTLCKDGLHLHLSIADKNGKAFGGHLMPGCIVHTTLEVGIVTMAKPVTFSRKPDPATNFKELSF
jgi:predicted DNA-binding protein with PD1-like motif